MFGTEKIRQALRGQSLAVAAIFLTASIICKVIGGFIADESAALSIEILSLLLCIALWVARGNAKHEDRFTGRGLRLASGVYYAMFIIFWIAAGLLILVGVIMLIGKEQVGNAIINGSSNVISGLFDSVVADIPGAQELFTEQSFATALASGAAVMCFIAAAIFLIGNYLYVRKVHKFIKSLRATIASGENQIRHEKGTKIWMLIIGIAGLISSLINLYNSGIPIDILRSICLAFTYLSIFAWINKNFKKEY